MLRNSPYSDYTNEDGSLVQYPMGSTVKRGYNYEFDRQYLDLDKGYTVLNTIFNAKVKLPFNITYDFNIAPRYEFSITTTLCRLSCRTAILQVVV